MRLSILLLFFLQFILAGKMHSQSDTVKLKAYGGVLFEEAAQLIEYSYGGYAVVGTTGSNQTGNTDIFIARFDQNLNCIWSNNFGGTNVEWASSITNDSNGNLMACGYTLSEGAGGYDMWIIKVNADGELVWQRTYGGPDWDFAKQIIPHPSGGFLVCGNTYSAGSGGQDGTLLHITGDGLLISQRFFGGQGNDGMNDIVGVSDGYVACGHETIDNNMKSRIWRFDANDNLIWDRTDDANPNENRMATAISAGGGQLCVVGSVTSEDYYRSFEQVLQSDNSNLVEITEVQDFDFSFLDCAISGGQVYLAGYRAVWGVELARLIRKQYDLAYTGGFEYSGPYLSRFNSVIATSEGLVFSGSYLQTSSQNWQVFLLKYSSSNLGPVSGTPQFFPCFSVGVEEESLPGINVEGQLINALGQVLIDNFKWDSTNQYPDIAPGIYYIRIKESGTAQRIWIGR
jgi:hypothetical protein